VLGIVPVPVSVEAGGGAPFRLTASTRIVISPGTGEVARVGEYLAGVLRRATGCALLVASAGEDGAGAGDVLLEAAAGGGPGEEGYRLDVTGESVSLRAAGPRGLFLGVQTLRQLLPPAIEGPTPRPGPWTVPACRIADHPRFPWRGAALDVARHFFTVEEVERYIDLISLYKLNVLHLHLTDDQGWRLAISSWPRLAEHGGSTQVDGGSGGWYTQAEYAEIVRYAHDRYITVVPEIDMPGHTNAALASYGELSCDGRATDLYTGTEVGFSSLCLEKEVTYRFLDDVIGEVAELTPGRFIHIGGDEAHTVREPDYIAFVERVQRIVKAHGKQAIGWQEIARAELLPTSVVQYWQTRADPAPVLRAARRGTRLVLSPANRTYLDLKYDERTELGLTWAGYVEVRDAYDWDPTTVLEGLGEERVLGVEAQLWSETLRGIADVELMALPRLPAIAEVGWSPPDRRDWDGFRRRLAAQGPRWSALGVAYHRSPQVPWGSWEP
jgi:hexosaminidase